MSVYYDFYVEHKEDDGKWKNICPKYDGEQTVTPITSGNSIVGQILDDVYSCSIRYSKFDCKAVFSEKTCEALKEEEEEFSKGAAMDFGKQTGIQIMVLDKIDLNNLVEKEFDMDGIVSKLDWFHYCKNKNTVLHPICFGDEELSAVDKMQYEQQYEYHQWVDPEGSLAMAKEIRESAINAINMYNSRPSCGYSGNISFDSDSVRIIAVIS